MTDKSRQPETGRHRTPVDIALGVGDWLLAIAMIVAAILVVLAALCGGLALVIFSARCAWEAGGR